ncbi:MAG: glycosyltransferase [Candidatus Levyibacteriota bacterium]
MKISIIIPTYRRVEQSLKTVELLLKSGEASGLDIEYIVSDSTENDSLKNGFASHFGDKVIFKKLFRRGIALGKNHGAELATGSIIIFCDSDIEVEEDTISSTIEALKGNPTAGGLGGQVIWKGGEKDGQIDAPHVHDRIKQIGSTIYLEAIYSRYFATYKKIFLKVGEYDDEVFNMRGEGSDISTRYWRAGFPLVYSSNIKIHHIYEAPESVTRVENPSWAVAKDLLLLGYKYDLFDGGKYKNFEDTIIGNFKSYVDEGYVNILAGIGSHFDFINTVKPILDRQKKEMKPLYDFKFLEVFSDEKLFRDCIESSAQRIKNIIEE